ncbi:MAG: serine/threonine protein kinase, partial [Candidatus Omnitrophica bacterium]|nr:serine/threonine protein kinase [Candidatus Omnitrophota bacterium]
SPHVERVPTPIDGLVHSLRGLRGKTSGSRGVRLRLVRRSKEGRNLVFSLIDEERGKELTVRVPRRLGDYKVTGILGSGGWGIVVSAQKQIGRTIHPVAIKIVPIDTGLESTERFEREVRALAKLNHPNIVRVIDRGVDEFPYYVMEHVDGPNLAEVVAEQKEKKLAAAQAVPLIRQALEGLAYAHEQGILHRDIKPGNLLLDKKNKRVVIADFGLSREAGATQLTLSRAQLGTPEYMAPEQVQNPQLVDVPTDMYAMGATLFTLVTGKLPYAGKDFGEVAKQVTSNRGPPLEEIQDAKLRLILGKALAKNPDARYQSAGEFIADLDRYSNGQALSVEAKPAGERFHGWWRAAVDAIIRRVTGQRLSAEDRALRDRLIDEGIYFLRINKRDEAKKHFERALKIDTYSKEAERYLSELSQPRIRQSSDLATIESESLDSRLRGNDRISEDDPLQLSQELLVEDDAARRVYSGLKPEETFGRFRIVRELGRGGMGIVYEAEDSGTGQRVALKILRNQLVVSGEERERFLEEARSLQSLQHEGIVRLIDVGEVEGTLYLAMNVEDPTTLETYLENPEEETQAGIDQKEALGLAERLAGTLEYMHSEGIVHGDLKPANVLASGKVIDFGLARQLDSRPMSNNPQGTPAYMAPEQARGEIPDARSDIYAWGATLYAILTGRAPYTGKNVDEILAQVREGKFTSLRKLRPDIDKAFARIIERAMAKDPARRYQSAEALAKDLKEKLPKILARQTKWRERVAVQSSRASEHRSPLAQILEERRRQKAEPYFERALEYILEGDKQALKRNQLRGAEAEEAHRFARNFFEHAVEDLERVVAGAPHYARAHFWLARTYYELSYLEKGRVEERNPHRRIPLRRALVHANETLAIDSKHAPARTTRAVVYEELGELERATRDYAVLIAESYSRGEDIRDWIMSYIAVYEKAESSFPVDERVIQALIGVIRDNSYRFHVKQEAMSSAPEGQPDRILIADANGNMRARGSEWVAAIHDLGRLNVRTEAAHSILTEMAMQTNDHPAKAALEVLAKIVPEMAADTINERLANTCALIDALIVPSRNYQAEREIFIRAHTEKLEPLLQAFLHNLDAAKQPTLEVRQAAIKALGQIGKKILTDLTLPEYVKKSKDRTKIARSIIHEIIEQKIAAPLCSTHEAIRITAHEALVGLGKAAVPVLLDGILTEEGLVSERVNILVAMGDDAVEGLQEVFERRGESDALKRELVDVLRQIGTERAAR